MQNTITSPILRVEFCDPARYGAPAIARFGNVIVMGETAIDAVHGLKARAEKLAAAGRAIPDPTALDEAIAHYAGEQAIGRLKIYDYDAGDPFADELYPAAPDNGPRVAAYFAYSPMMLRAARNEVARRANDDVMRDILRAVFVREVDGVEIDLFHRQMDEQQAALMAAYIQKEKEGRTNA